MHRFNLLRRIPFRRCRACGRTLTFSRVAVVPQGSSTFEQICPTCADWARRVLAYAQVIGGRS